IAIAALIPSIILLHLVCAPYTKVEESFNIQATHDILTHGIREFIFPFGSGRLLLKDHYDHLTFTGPVPRTFVGALTLAGVSWPFVKVFEGVNPQIIVRAILGLWNAFCLLYFRNGIESRFGKGAANWFVVFQASGFHVMYYASRTLPNFFAFGLESNLSTNNAHTFLLIVTTIGVIFRSELALFLIPHTLLLLLTHRLSIASTIKSGILGAILGLAITIPIDSFFWQRFPLWPELSAFSYNILNAQSSNWGTSPWHFYFTSALPRLLFNPLLYILCIPLAVSQPALRRSVAELLIPNLAFVALYSLQPHKEWRFIIYTIPPFLTAAALGANWIWTRRSKSGFYRILSLTLVISVLASFAASGAMLAVSRLNYPGAEALNRLHAIAPVHLSQQGHQIQIQGNGMGKTMVNVHMDTLACMTGTTRFQQLPAPPLAAANHDLDNGGGDVEKGMEDMGKEDLFWVYDKTEDEERLLTPLFWERFDWVLAEDPRRVIGKWEIVETVDAFAGLRVLRPGDVGSGVESGGKAVRDIVDMVKAGDVRSVWGLLERYGRKVTRGWWVGVRMEPRISILKRQRDIPLPLGGDW
ncbi:MAG: hypothetical protein Q9169_004762, partial [Polycauliona sp. 2 TL-2023]